MASKAIVIWTVGFVLLSGCSSKDEDSNQTGEDAIGDSSVAQDLAGDSAAQADGPEDSNLPADSVSDLAGEVSDALVDF